MPTIEKILDGFFFMNHIETLFGVLKPGLINLYKEHNTPAHRFPEFRGSADTLGLR